MTLVKKDQEDLKSGGKPLQAATCCILIIIRLYSIHPPILAE